MVTSADLKVKVFADGADLKRMAELAQLPIVKGFTTNPTLMRQSGVTQYTEFAELVLRLAGDRPVSFEVFADDLAEMQKQAHVIAAWGHQVYVKIPVTTTRGESTDTLVRTLSEDGLRINVTAIMTLAQVRIMTRALADSPGAVISVFAGRIADTGRDPLPMMAAALETVRDVPKIELLWASPREVLNVVQASDVGCHIITVTYDLLAKLAMLGKNLEAFSLQTVQMFHDDGRSAGLNL